MITTTFVSSTIFSSFSSPPSSPLPSHSFFFLLLFSEWYSWHFPELVKIVPDNYNFARLVIFVKAKNTLTKDSVEGLEDITGDGDKAKQIVEAAKTSMGTDISEFDLLNIIQFASRVVNLHEYRQKLADYLSKKMYDVAPSLTALMGESIGARLIAHAGSLTNLAKYPASTVQILGAEKALFRALKTKGKTPKYGIIFNSSFIGKANTKNKGRISRYLANKASIAARIDAFSEAGSSVGGSSSSATIFGQKLKEQVEERLRFYDSGTTPRKNIDVMKEAIKQTEQLRAKEGGGSVVAGKKKSKKSKGKEEEPAKKKKAVAEEPSKKKKKAVVEESSDEESEEEKKKSKKSTSSKKRRASSSEADGEKKKKKKKKSKSN
jgi:nucleolar protein 56